MPITNKELADLLVKQAQKYVKEMKNTGVIINRHMNAYRDGEPDQKLVDAVVVDFINYVMRQGGMDLALYTIDLREKVDKKEG
jgi:hypothetical protein